MHSVSTGCSVDLLSELQPLVACVMMPLQHSNTFNFAYCLPGELLHLPTMLYNSRGRHLLPSGGSYNFPPQKYVYTCLFPCFGSAERCSVDASVAKHEQAGDSIEYVEASQAQVSAKGQSVLENGRPG